jgi:hypothetical protein
MERDKARGAGEVPMRRAWRERGKALLQLEQVRKELTNKAGRTHPQLAERMARADEIARGGEG